MTARLLKDHLALFLFLVTIFDVSSGTVRAEESMEESRRHQLGYGVGVALTQFREDMLTSLRWLGVKLEIGVEYRYNGSNNRHQAFLGLALLSHLENRFGDVSKAKSLDIGYCYHAKLFADPSIGEFWLGPTLRYIIDVQHYTSWNASHLYWLTTLDFGPSGAWHKRMGNEHDIWVELQFPLVAFASRPARDRYFADDLLRNAPGLTGVWEDHIVGTHENMRFTSLNEYASIRLKAEYLYAITTGIEIGGCYKIGYRTYSQPEWFQHLYQELAIRVAHNL